MLKKLYETYGQTDCRDLGSRQLEQLRDGLKCVQPEEICSSKDGETYIELLRMFREAVAENDKLHGDNYPQLLNSILSVGEDGLYSNSLRFIFELIQNVDDCDFVNPEDCRLDMKFRFNEGEIILTYNEVGFTPFNVFAITGIAEAAKNVSASKNEIGEKGIGFKSVFGVAKRVYIQSGWFSFELYKENFTIPVACYQKNNLEYCQGTRMTLYVPGKAEEIYGKIKRQYCRKDALFSRNPLLFLNKLTTLKIYFDSWRSMEFHVSSKPTINGGPINREDNVIVSVDLHDAENGREVNVTESILCTRYTKLVTYSREACQSRYGINTAVGSNGGKQMLLQAVVPYPEFVADVGTGALYSFLPTQIKLSVPVVCHVPFKLDASREFVDPQGENTWFEESSEHLSDLMEYTYKDWSRTVGNNIIWYVPGLNESLFSRNNGKEECLKKQQNFLGKKYLNINLFKTMDGEFKAIDDIFCFDQEEEVTEPEKVYRLMGYHKALFIPPEEIKPGRYGLFTEKNVNTQLFKRAMANGNITAEALDYLDSIGFEYNEKLISDTETLKLTPEQIVVIMKHPKIAAVFQQVSSQCIKQSKRPRFSIASTVMNSLSDVIQSGFDITETPRQIEKYLTFCEAKCLCLDMEEDQYLACYNGVVLSANNVLSSLAAFCYSIDQRDTFAIRIKLREASMRLNKYVEDDAGTAGDYLRDLKNIRLLVKDSLGSEGYRSYIDLILKSGTDRGRFVQEVLQNADDCIYPKGDIPSFKLWQTGSVVCTEYNETGFTRANIRSITAIGESTKNKLLNSEYMSIGEKGVGFKTVFAVASEVKIFSGEYNFSLTDREPTIPKILKAPAGGNIKGTRMEIVLKDKTIFPSYDDKALLELVLCLRNLKKIDICNHTISIEDSPSRRVITIDNRQHAFKKFEHPFTVTDSKALEEKKNGTRAISPVQQIVCYVPERNELPEYCLYVGLPTKHKIHIPIAIDAPFELTTSRETIEDDCSTWNNIVREEMYNALISVMQESKQEERANVLRFARFRRLFTGNQNAAYFNDISDSQYLNQYDYLSRLQNERILPTLDSHVFVSVNNMTAYRYPKAAILLLGMMPPAKSEMIRFASVIDSEVEGISKEQRERLDAVFNALACKTAEFSNVFPFLEKYAEEYIENADFRSELYEYLQNTPIDYQKRVSLLKIIPAYGVSGGVRYISWIDNGIFVKKNVTKSDSSYWVLNESFLSKPYCERMMGVNINEMNEEWERARYNENLQKIINGDDIIAIYLYLLVEYKSQRLDRNNSIGILLAHKESIPLKNVCGEITDTEMFLCDQPAGYFSVDMLRRLTVHDECADFAEYIKCNDLSGIHYEDIDYYEELTADDVEALLDDYFVNSEEILRGFYKDGFLSDELLEEYNLEYLVVGRATDNGVIYSFPEQRVVDMDSLRKHVSKQWNSPVKIVSVKVERSVQKGQKADGETFDLGINDAREGALNIYAPEGKHGICFCQMCHKVRPTRLMEVNNIQLYPKYYFPQLRIAFCLECSKKFEFFRNNTNVRNDFMDAIKNALIQYQGKVDIPIGDTTITFTGQHLAEIQEILKKIPE